MRQWRTARAGLGQTLRTGRALVGLSFLGVLRRCTNSPGPRHEKGGRCRPGSLALGVGQLLVIRTPWVALSAESHVDLAWSTVKTTKNKQIVPFGQDDFATRADRV